MKLKTMQILMAIMLIPLSLKAAECARGGPIHFQECDEYRGFLNFQGKVKATKVEEKKCFVQIKFISSNSHIGCHCDISETDWVFIHTETCPTLDSNISGYIRVGFDYFIELEVPKSIQ